MNLQANQNQPGQQNKYLQETPQDCILQRPSTMNSLNAARKDEFEQVIAIITARLDTVPAQRVDSISSSDTILPKNLIALILQKLEEDFAGDNIVNKTKIEKQMNSLPNGTDATSIEILLNQLTTLNSALAVYNARKLCLATIRANRNTA